MEIDTYKPNTCEIVLSLLKSRLEVSLEVKEDKSISEMIDILGTKVTNRSKLFMDIVGEYTKMLGEFLTDQESNWITKVLNKQLETNFMESKVQLEKLNLFHKTLRGDEITWRKILLCIETFLQLAMTLAINKKSSAINAVEWLAKTIDTVPLNSSHLTVLGWVNTTGGWIEVICKNEGAEEKPRADENKSQEYKIGTTCVAEKEIEQKNQMDMKETQEVGQSSTDTSKPTDKMIEPAQVKDNKLTPQALVRPPQIGLPAYKGFPLFPKTRFFPFEIIVDGVSKLIRRCKKCWRDMLFPLEPYKGICKHCNEKLCLIKNCGVALSGDKRLAAHMQVHRNEDLTKCFECGADKYRSEGRYSRCPNCSIFWCMGDNCGHEYYTLNSVVNHFNRAHKNK